MACNCATRNPGYKSCVHTFNSTSQPVTAAGATLAIGSPVTYTGVSLTPGANSVVVNTRGLYRFAADVVFTGAATSSSSSSSSTSDTSTAATNNVETVQLYNGTTALPCNLAQNTVNGNAVASFHVETELQLYPCVNVTPTISVKASGEAGTVTFVDFTATKLA